MVNMVNNGCFNMVKIQDPTDGGTCLRTIFGAIFPGDIHCLFRPEK